MSEGAIGAFMNLPADRGFMVMLFVLLVSIMCWIALAKD